MELLGGRKDWFLILILDILEVSQITVKKKKGDSIEAMNYNLKHESFHVSKLHLST